MSIICSAVRGMLYATLRGAWRSPVARLLWEQDVGGSNPLAPTSLIADCELWIADFDLVFIIILIRNPKFRNPQLDAPVAQVDRATAF
jgi:hypothetical protein